MDETNTEISDITTEDKHDTENAKVSCETFDKTEVPDIMTKVLEFRDNAHAGNVRKLKAGIKCIFIVPACFLILLFFTNSSKIIFLVLWIASLFLIAAYLIHVEYSDYKIQEMVNSLQDSEGGIDSLIDIDSIYTRVSAPKRKLDEKIDTIIINVKSESRVAAAETDSETQGDVKTGETQNVVQNEDSEDATSNEPENETSEDKTPIETQNEGSVDETPNETQNEDSVDKTPNEIQDRISNNIEQEEQTQ